MTTALLLCRTPLQAHILSEAIRQEQVRTYDLLYFTQHNSEEDRRQFEHLVHDAELARYLHVPRQRFDVLNHIITSWRASPFRRDLQRDLVMLGSLDIIAFNAIARRQRHSELVTFDDGVGNIVADGIYSSDLGGRAKLYRLLLGAERVAKIRERITRHYTIFPGAPNIVPAEKLRTVQLGTRRLSVSTSGPVFFIGQPFHEILTTQQIERLREFLATQAIDFYVRHPRETAPLSLGVPMLDKHGMIAEDAIVAACKGTVPTLIGVSSAVLFTFSSEHARKIMLVFPERATDSWIPLAAAAGCTLVEVP